MSGPCTRVRALRACLNHPPKEHWNELIFFLFFAGSVGTLILIGCRHRTDSMQPEENSFLGKRKNTCLTTFSSLGEPDGPTERAQSLVC